MSDYQIIDTNADNIGGCSLCGNKNAHKLGYRRKTNWLKQRYAEGLRYKVLRTEKFGDIGMIEYALGNQAWRPVEAEGYFVIHCLMVNSKHKGKGLGTLLLDSCLRDAKKSKCRGVAVVTSSDSFMAKRDLFLKAGFIAVDRIPPMNCWSRNCRRQPLILVSSSKGNDCPRGSGRALRSWLPISARMLQNRRRGLRRRPGRWD